MYIAGLNFPGAGLVDSDLASEKIHSLLAAYRMNGQTCSGDWKLAANGDEVVVTINLPHLNALESSHANQYVSSSLASLRDSGLCDPVITMIGRDIDSLLPCECTTIHSYVLFTHFLTIESPLRCGDCWQPVPLYNVPPTDGDNYYDIVGWQADYQACDTLQMHCNTLERAAEREMSQLASSLSQGGIGICNKISQSTNIPVYYYLYRNRTRSMKRELERRCPSCEGAWRLEKPWHIFDFKCDRCHLLSNIAPSIR